MKKTLTIACAVLASAMICGCHHHSSHHHKHDKHPPAQRQVHRVHDNRVNRPRPTGRVVPPVAKPRRRPPTPVRK